MSEMATLVPPGGLPSPTASKKTFGVEALNIVKRFGEFAALDQVSLKVRPGTFHALLVRMAQANRRSSSASWAITKQMAAS